MRVISGKFRGRTLAGPKWAGLRPTSDMVRETLFNILGASVDGARVLDAYAGTGALGIEALSRGAAFVAFVERDPRAQKLIAENLRRCGVSEGYVMMRAATGLRRRFAGGPGFDLILVDPPYDEADLAAAVGQVGFWLAAGGLLVLEHARRRVAPPTAAGLVATRTVESGDSALTFYRPSAPATGTRGENGVRDVSNRPRFGGVPMSDSSEPQTDRVSPGTGRVAVYPGSFDPLTNGHVDIILRGARLFDRIVVAILVNPEKTALFSIEERIEMARAVFRDESRVEVEAFGGLLVDYARRRGAAVIVRGLRAVSDFEYEFQMALMNRRLVADIETVFMMPAEAYTYTSSRIIREIFALGGSISGLVPAIVETRLREKFAGR